MKRFLTHLVPALAATLSLTACGGDPLATTPGQGSSGGSVVVGSANFPESNLLAEIYAQALRAKGVSATTKLNIGSREVSMAALKDGSIDMLPEYNGALLNYFTGGDATQTTTSEINTALKKALPKGLTVLDASEAQDKDGFAVTKETAKKYGLSSLADLKQANGKLVLGGASELRTRFVGIKGLKQVYGLDFKQYKPLDAAGPLTVAALKDGAIDVANLYTTQSTIKQNGFVVLDDPKHPVAAENVLPVARKSKMSPDVKSTLNAVSAELTTKDLAALVKQVEIDKSLPRAVAKSYISEHGLD
ncbi:ABC transporter substrate-binding protein [Streptomyces sp. NPDC087849]|uniref:ABC transporter substrate-binding protein n=1 Tax=Streptomyces sp. NPDC087849 TaxID=3365808 RepID=UPI003803DC95